MDKILTFLGMMRRARALCLGAEEAGTACREGRAQLLLLAADAGAAARRELGHWAEASGQELRSLPYAKGELGQALGIRECAALAVTDPGFARALRDKLEPTGPQVIHSTAKGV